MHNIKGLVDTSVGTSVIRESTETGKSGLGLVSDTVSLSLGQRTTTSSELSPESKLYLPPWSGGKVNWEGT